MLYHKYSCHTGSLTDEDIKHLVGTTGLIGTVTFNSEYIVLDHDAIPMSKANIDMVVDGVTTIGELLSLMPEYKYERISPTQTIFKKIDFAQALTASFYANLVASQNKNTADSNADWTVMYIGGEIATTHLDQAWAPLGSTGKFITVPDANFYPMYLMNPKAPIVNKTQAYGTPLTISEAAPVYLLENGGTPIAQADRPWRSWNSPRGPFVARSFGNSIVICSDIMTKPLYSLDGGLNWNVGTNLKVPSSSTQSYNVHGAPSMGPNYIVGNANAFNPGYIGYVATNRLGIDNYTVGVAAQGSGMLVAQMWEYRNGKHYHVAKNGTNLEFRYLNDSDLSAFTTVGVISSFTGVPVYGRITFVSDTQIIFTYMISTTRYMFISKDGGATWLDRTSKLAQFNCNEWAPTNDYIATNGLSVVIINAPLYNNGAIPNQYFMTSLDGGDTWVGGDYIAVCAQFAEPALQSIVTDGTSYMVSAENSMFMKSTA